MVMLWTIKRVKRRIATTLTYRVVFCALWRGNLAAFCAELGRDDLAWPVAAAHLGGKLLGSGV